MFNKIAGLILTSLVMAVVLGFITGIFVMWLWNASVAEVLHVQRIGFWQAWCLVVLCNFLFKTSVTTKE